jgi:FtsH-binding integral membrane protein
MGTIDTTVDAPKAIVIAGLLGSLMSLTFIDGMGKRQRFVAVMAGTIMAHYLTPLIAHMYAEDNYAETIGFLIGLFGMSITAAIFRAIQSSDLWNFIMRRWGGNNNTQDIPQPPPPTPAPGGE